MSHDVYVNPLISRYASREMAQLFSPRKRIRTWREMWIALAEAECELGVTVTQEQVDDLKANIDNIDFERAAVIEKERRHDVMAHTKAYGEVATVGAPIIHLGVTSCFVTDNADLVIFREALRYVTVRLASVIDRLSKFASEYKSLPTLGFTHLQPAQPTTVGKRATLWAYDLALDLEELEDRISKLKCRGVKGTTGTQASFLKLCDGDHEKVKEINRRVCEKIGFESAYEVTGQTYSRKIDTHILSVLSDIAQSCHKIATDIRLLQNRNEVEEPFEKGQVGSSAMAYKRNPMRSERICSLSRFVMSMHENAANTLATQWMERTLDDSANRRLTLPQAFLGIDAILILMQNVTDGLVVYPKVIAKNLDEKLPFMVTENIMMAAAEQGGDRDQLHEAIKDHSHAASAVVKAEGLPNDLINRLKNDPHFANVDIDAELDSSKLIGRCPEQVDEFIAAVVDPIRSRYAGKLDTEAEVFV